LSPCGHIARAEVAHSSDACALGDHGGLGDLQGGAHLAGWRTFALADFADLDGNLLVSNDPYCGVEMRKGRIILTERAGLGGVPAPER